MKIACLIFLLALMVMSVKSRSRAFRARAYFPEPRNYEGKSRWNSVLPPFLFIPRFEYSFLAKRGPSEVNKFVGPGRRPERS